MGNRAKVRRLTVIGQENRYPSQSNPTDRSPAIFPKALLLGCESKRVVKQQRLLNRDCESFVGLLSGCATNHDVCSRTLRATGSERESDPPGPNRRKPLKRLDVNAKRRKLGLTAFCVNQYGGSFRASYLSSPSATLFELARETRALKPSKTQGK
jgi:hypothetical protein